MGKVNKSMPKLTLKSVKATTSGKINKGKQSFKNQSKVFLPFLNKTAHDKSSDLNINITNLKKNKGSKDVKNILSYKSRKSLKPVNKRIKKKEKLNLKRNLLMKKIDTIKHIKQEQGKREKRKNTSVIGDTNPLHDALPSLQPLLLTKMNYKSPQQNKKKKGIEKAKQRKKHHISDIAIFKRAMNDNIFKSNPLEIILSHVQAVVEDDRSKVN